MQYGASRSNWPRASSHELFYLPNKQLEERARRLEMNQAALQQQPPISGEFCVLTKPVELAISNSADEVAAKTGNGAVAF